jgi:hypothetical protein
MPDYRVQIAVEVWAQFTHSVNGSLGYGRGSSLSRVLAEGAQGAAIRADYGSREPRDAHQVPRRYVLVDRALRSLPRPDRYRRVLMAEAGILDECAGCRRQHEKAAKLGMTADAYQSRLAKIRKAIARELAIPLQAPRARE